MLTQAKDLFKGQRPKGYDVVFTLTTKDLTVLGQTAVAGLADCIGGVRFPERAFAVGEVIEFEDLAFGPLTFYKHATAETAAHEIGHLMGGHHQYANCAEGAQTRWRRTSLPRVRSCSTHSISCPATSAFPTGQWFGATQ